MASIYIVFIFIGLVKAQNPCEYVLHIFITQTTREYVHVFIAQTTCEYVLHGFIAQVTCENVLHIFIHLVKAQALCNR